MKIKTTLARQIVLLQTSVTTAVTSLVLPVISYAQEQGTAAVVCSRKIGNLKELFSFPVCIINRYLIPLMITVAIASFIFGIVRYIANADNQAERLKMKDFILWSLLAIFIILSVWAILYFVGNSLQLGQ